MSRTQHGLAVPSVNITLEDPQRVDPLFLKEASSEDIESETAHLG